MTAALVGALLSSALAGCSAAVQDPAPATGAQAPAAGAAGRARAALDGLPVKGRAPKTGYDRVGSFGAAWSDKTSAPGAGNHCDTRNDILRRDLSNIRFLGTSHCVVASGVLADPYTGRSIRFVRGAHTSSAVQIDHRIPLSLAWQTGAQAISAAQRAALGSDPLNLLSADGPANGQKSDGDAATWLPPNRAFRCPYVARQIAVRVKYRLWVTAPERTAMLHVLDSCPTQPLPTDASAGVALTP